MLFKILVTFLVVAFSSSLKTAYALETSRYSTPLNWDSTPLHECVGGSHDYDDYIQILSQCYKARNIDIPTGALNFIKSSPPEDLNLQLLKIELVAAARRFSQPLIEGRELDVSELIKRQPDWIYVLDRTIRGITQTGRMGRKVKSELLSEVYNAFDPIQLAALQGTVKVASTGSGSEAGFISGSASVGATAAGSGSMAILGMFGVVALDLVTKESDPEISVEDVLAIEDSSATALFTVILSKAHHKTVTVVYATADGSASAADYTSVSGTLVFAAGETSKSVSIPVVADSLDEANETVSITLSNPTNASIADASGVLTIQDDDPAPTLSISSASVSEDATFGSITVSLSAPSGKSVTVDYGTGLSGTATSEIDFVATSGNLVFSAGETNKTISVATLDDSVFEGDENIPVTISNALNATIALGTTSLTIVENEAVPTVTLSGGTTISESGSAVTLSVSLSGEVDEDVTIALTIAGTSESADYLLSSSTVTIPSLTTTDAVTIRPLDDAIFEGDETLVLSIANISGGGVLQRGTQSETITITDDESVPSFSLSITEASVSEGGPPSEITVTMSGPAEADAAITLSGSGTATAGSDYVALSAVSIPSGNTTGTATFNAIADSIDELLETATITISSISLGNAAAATGSNDSITIRNIALNSGTAALYDETNEAFFLTSTEFDNSDYGSAGRASDQNPYETINLHKALSYEDSLGNKILGEGQTISIMDSGFQVAGLGATNTTHQEFDDKSISYYDAAWFTNYNWTSNYHGTMVAGIAAGNFDSVGTMGVAPGASLHLHDFKVLYSPVWWAAGTADAESAGAVVQNNSWGFDEQYGSAGTDSFVSHMTNNSISGAATLVHYQGVDTDGDGRFDVGATASQRNWTEANWDAYVDALDSFQDGGVIVFALSNDSSKTDADISAGLPELFPQLSEAWITVANVDVQGISAQTVTLVSAPCGSTAEYCLGADGTNIVGPGGDDFYTSSPRADNWYKLSSGSSFAAPQISGAVAVLSSHFPNHSPEKLVDRLLATANNDFTEFVPVGTLIFGNGVQHSYSRDFGHGVMDLYAALQPIVTDMVRIVTGDNLREVDEDAVFDMQDSVLRSTAALGDALKTGLLGEKGYVYDDLDGGFAYEIEQHVALQSAAANSLKMSDGMDFLNSLAPTIKKRRYGPITGMVTDSEKDRSNMGLTVRSQILPVQRLFHDAGISSSDLDVSYLSESSSLGFASEIQIGASNRLSFGATRPTTSSENAAVGDQQTFAAAFETFSDATAMTVLLGVTKEDSDLLGMQGGGAFSLEGAASNTFFWGARNSQQINERVNLEALAILGNTSMSKPKQGLVDGADQVKTLSWNLGLTVTDVFDDDLFGLSVSQPNKVIDGTMTMRLPNLADANGNISYRKKVINLTPSGRQLDFSIGYQHRLDKSSTVAMKHMVSTEPNHDSNAEDVQSSFVGFTRNGFELGFVTRHGHDYNKVQLNYSISF